MSLDDRVKDVLGYVKAFAVLFYEHEYSDRGLVNKLGSYSEKSDKTSYSRNNAIHNTYHNNLDDGLKNDDEQSEVYKIGKED